MTQPVPANGPAAPIAYLVDDNEPFRRSTSLLLETAFIDVRGFDSGAALLAQAYAAAARSQGEGFPALETALSYYNTGTAYMGFKNGYVKEVKSKASSR